MSSREAEERRRRNERRGARERSEEARAFERKHHAMEDLWERARGRTPETERNWGKRHKHIGFEALEEKVYREYIAKGYPPMLARRWAKATAGKVWHRQHAMG